MNDNLDSRLKQISFQFYYLIKITFTLRNYRNVIFFAYFPLVSEIGKLKLSFSQMQDNSFSPIQFCKPYNLWFHVYYKYLIS